MKIKISIDLADIADSDLREELTDRGLCVYDEPSDALSSIDADMLREELQSRDGGDLTSALRESLVVEWLRKSDPPQAVRDAFYNTYGRILL